MDNQTVDTRGTSTLERSDSALRGANQSSSITRSAWFWPALVIGLLAGQIVLVLVMAYLAVSDHSFAVEPDYYRKALRWNSEISQQQANRRLGWTMHIEVSEQADLMQQRDVRCAITDPAGLPVAGAHVEIVAFPHVRGNERQELMLSEPEAGRYGATVRMSQGGLWEFRITAQRGADLVTHVEQLQVRNAEAVTQ